VSAEVHISQHPRDWLDIDIGLPPVDASASVEASRIMADILAPRMRVDEDGIIVVSHAALHRMALAIEYIREHGYPCEEEPF